MNAESKLLDTDLIARKDALISTELNDLVVVMSIETGLFFQLNKTGSRIWSLLEEPRSFAAICAEMRERFDVSPDACRADLTAFVETMRGKGLLVVT